jgi:hypothetical protein
MPSFSGIVVPTSAESSGRRPFSEVIDELARPVDASDTTIRNLAADAFRAAVRRLNRNMWTWEVVSEELTLTTNVRFSTVASAIKKPLSMHYLSATGGTEKEKIGYIEYGRFLEKFTLDVVGQAHAYTIPNLFETGQVRWFPVPSATDYARFTFYRVTPAPRVESEALEIPDHATELYMAFAWAEFLKRLPSEQRPFPIQIAIGDARVAFREMSAHVADPGDRSREVGPYG